MDIPHSTPLAHTLNPQKRGQANEGGYATLPPQNQAQAAREEDPGIHKIARFTYVDANGENGGQPVLHETSL